MDLTSRSAPADRLARIEAVLERARLLTGTELPKLVFAFRGEGRAGEQDRLVGERRRTRSRAISIAIARSGLARQADQLKGAAATAVRSAAERHWKTDGLKTLGLLFDAELAAADAVLAVLLEDHLSVEMARLLSQPFERATSGAAAATKTGA
jgi:hypothetical protein